MSTFVDASLFLPRVTKIDKLKQTHYKFKSDFLCEVFNLSSMAANQYHSTILMEILEILSSPDSSFSTSTFATERGYEELTVEAIVYALDSQWELFDYLDSPRTFWFTQVGRATYHYAIKAWEEMKDDKK